MLEHLLSILKLLGFMPILMCGGGGGSPEPAPPPVPPPIPTAGETAEDIYKARLKYDPLSAQQSFDIASNQDYGTEAWTGLIESIRQSVFPQEQGVRQQLGQNIMGGLLGEFGITEAQRESQEAIRGREKQRLVQGIRERANLGGTLFSGGAQKQERLGSQELGQAFATEDISRDSTNRQNALLAAYPYLQMLFPNSGIVAPQFQSAVPSPSGQLNAQMAGRGQNINYGQGVYGTQAGMYNQQQASQSALQSAMWGALGSAVGGIR